MDAATYLALLDRALAFAARHTDSDGRMVLEGEIDTKDSGWLVLGGVIRGVEAGWTSALGDLCRRWTLASIRVDDRRSAWTTFALLYGLTLSGGLKGEYARLFSESEREELRNFFLRIDMRFLMEASRNYRVAAALIDHMRLTLGYIDRVETDPDEHIRAMLAAYLGDGFFNDDDCRGSRGDRRIDAYSFEIIGLLLHYDELFGFASTFHDDILRITGESCRAARFLTDRDGELAKWGRSLRGEAEVKKLFLFEFAAREGLHDPGECEALARKLLHFTEESGLSPEGQFYKDKGRNLGVWDEYTTHVQAQGYGVYGLAMALKFASGSRETAQLPAEAGSFIRYFEGPRILVCNTPGGFHYILPLANRMTKNMYFWHNRITGENDVEVDVSAKFLPVPYFGRRAAAPYSAPLTPYLPMVRLANGELLVPRNLEEVEETGEFTFRQRFHYCRAAEYTPAIDLELAAEEAFSPETMRFVFRFKGVWPKGAAGEICGFLPEEVRWNLAASPEERPASIYGPATGAWVHRFAPCAEITSEWSF